MAKGVFIHNQISNYDDMPSQHYHFPAMYLKRASQIVGDWVLYYESGKDGGKRSYTAVARIEKIIPDPQKNKMFYAVIQPRSYVEFEVPVPFRIDGLISNSFLSNPDGTANNGKIVWAVQPINNADFIRILEYGLPDETEELPREAWNVESPPQPSNDGFMETPQSEFTFSEERKSVEVVFNKKVRDRAFRTNVINAYDRRCAFTGLRFINGGGRAEVQAAHIKPVSENGPDSVKNGLALSGTVHWMFDRGMLSLSDEHDILVSRHVNNIDEINRLILKERRAILPEKREHWPHQKFLEWHRDHCFKV